jgi:hypothetical protein
MNHTTHAITDTVTPEQVARYKAIREEVLRGGPGTWTSFTVSDSKMVVRASTERAYGARQAVGEKDRTWTLGKDGRDSTCICDGLDPEDRPSQHCPVHSDANDWMPHIDTHTLDFADDGRELTVSFELDGLTFTREVNYHPEEPGDEGDPRWTAAGGVVTDGTEWLEDAYAQLMYAWDCWQDAETSFYGGV